MKKINLPKESEIKNLQPREYSIIGHIGLKIRVRKGGTITWRYIYKDSMTGKARSKTLGRYPAVDTLDAVLLWSVARKEVIKGKDPQRALKEERIKNIDAPTVDEVFEEFLVKDKKMKQRIHIEPVRELMKNNVSGMVGDKKIDDVTNDDVDKILDAIKSVTQPQRVYTLLYQFFGYAWKADRVKENIMLKQDKPDLPKGYEPRSNDLSDKEIKFLWYGFDPFTNKDREKPIMDFVPPAFKILLLTGLHVQEIRLAKWIDIDMEDERVWHIPAINRKVRKTYDVCISDLCMEQLLILKQLNGDHEYILGNGYADASGFRNVVRRILTRTDNPVWTPKDTRTTFATILGKVKVLHEIRQRCLGHAVKSIEEKSYQKYDFIDERREAFQKMADYIKRVCGIEDSGLKSLDSLSVRMKLKMIESFADRHQNDAAYNNVKYLMGLITESLVEDIVHKSSKDSESNSIPSLLN